MCKDEFNIIKRGETNLARLVKTVEGQIVKCQITTYFEDGGESIKIIGVDDIVEDLRYVEDEEVKVVTGRVAAINTVCSNVTRVSVSDPQDYFSRDVVASTIQVDASDQYRSELVTVPAREIVEDEGVEDVSRVWVTTIPEVTLEMTYTDGRTIQQDVVIGDVLCDMVIMTSPGQPDITGDFTVAAFVYTSLKQKVTISGMYLVSLDGSRKIKVAFKDVVRFNEKGTVHITEDDSLQQVSEVLAEEDEVFAYLDKDVTIPLTEDGKIKTLMINEGKKLTFDLNGHSLNTQAYAFYVNGGELIIKDSYGDGVITGSMPNKAYPIVFINSEGVCTMESGTIDTTQVYLEEGDLNWLYGVVCSGNGIFNMHGGRILTQDAAGISITNGTASGAGAIFDISGDAEITSNDCTAIYLADNKEVSISGDAVINGGALLRLGNLSVYDNATINGTPDGVDVYPLGQLVCESGCENHSAAILAMTGCYNSELGNDLNISIRDNARVNGNVNNAIDIATLNTRYDQTVRVHVDNSENISCPGKLWNIYDHAQLAEMAAEQGKTLAPEQSYTDLEIYVDDQRVYPEETPDNGDQG